MTSYNNNKMTYLAVKTQDKAIKILQENYPKGAGWDFTREDRCECGITNTVCILDFNIRPLASVLVCDACGNDDNFIEDILKRY